jgi:two-component system nitrogen regulation response regulator NtrX
VVEDFERSFLLRALRDNDGNISRTAEAIGMVRQSLQQKIRELELRDEDWKKPV